MLPADSDHVRHNRYHLFSQVVTGGMGETLRAWDKQAGRPVVIKRPRRSLIDTSDFLVRFQREVRTMKRLNHPHIVPIVDDGVIDDLPFYAMPFLPGGSLYTRRLRDETGKALQNPPGMLALWLPQIAEALDHLHTHGIVHRDVKPANILFDVFWHASLADFGIAKVVGESAGFDKEETLTAAHMPVGTQEYMGPELFAPIPMLAGAVDQYALAVTVFELLAGRRPFVGESAHVVVEITMTPPPSLALFRSDLPPTLVEAVERGLAKRPQDRFVTCGEFARAVLAHVPPRTEDPNIARLACPTCANIIRIATKDAGRTGACPKCRERLVIADDMSALWTSSEQAIIAAALAGHRQPTTSDAGASKAATAPSRPIKFTPLSKTTPPPRTRRNQRQEVRRATIVTLALLAACVVVMCVGALVIPPRPPLFQKDPASGKVFDDGRIRIFSPKGFTLAPRKKAAHLAEYTQSRHGQFPQVRVYAGGDPPDKAKQARLNRDDPYSSRFGMIWPARVSRKQGLPAKLASVCCSVEVAARRYRVEVTVPEEDLEKAELLCRLVAEWLEPANP